MRSENEAHKNLLSRQTEETDNTIMPITLSEENIAPSMAPCLDSVANEENVADYYVVKPDVGVEALDSQTECGTLTLSTEALTLRQPKFTPNDIGYFRLPIYEHFKGGNFYCVSGSGEKWDMLKLAADNSAKVIRQRVEHGIDRGTNRWTKESVRLLIRWEKEVFVFSQFSNMIIVYADTLRKAQAVYDEIKAGYFKRDRRRQNKPFFHILSLTSRGCETEEVEVNRCYAQTDETLSLHYGEDLLEWERGLARNLAKKESGITILQGAPGTGKTCYLRHLVQKLCKKCCFYYLPQTNYSLLCSPNMVPFWAEQSRRYPKKKKVVIIEDAESILLKRAGDNREEVGNLLNISDGFLGNFMKMHILCTINTEVKDLDSALLRRGRLIAYREFGRIGRERALAIAGTKGIDLPDQNDYSLAEIYSQDHLWQEIKKEKKVGF